MDLRECGGLRGEVTMAITQFSDEYRFLNNFYICLVEWEGKVWKSVEHAFQAAKTLNLSEREIIRTLDTPGQAKRAGRKVELRPNWGKVRIGIMTQLVFSKFDQNPELKQRLLDTHPQDLEEGNKHGDVFWGTCKGKGRNTLGRILMSVRALFILGAAPKN